MAAVVSAGVAAGDTSNSNPYVTGSFTPTAGDLLVCVAYYAGTVDTGASATASANGITFTRVHHHLGDAGGKRMAVFVADQLVPSSPVAMTVTFDVTAADPATGCAYDVLRVSGMSKTGTTAVKQVVGTDNNLTASSTPAVTFGAAPQSGNPVVGWVGNNTNPATQTEPTGFTERADVGFATPNTGLETCSIDSSGPTTLTWGSTSTRGAVGAVELDASATGLGGTLGVTTETDSAQPLGRRKVKALGTATETDTALPITAAGDLGGTLGITTETDAAVALGRTKSKSVGPSAETDAAQPLGRIKRKAVGTATETDSAVGLTRRKVKSLAVAVETDTALTITRFIGGVAVGAAVETDVAMPLARIKRKAVGTAIEVDMAMPVAPSFVLVTYTPPTYEKPIRMWGNHILNYYSLTTAASIVKINGVFTAIVTPNPELLEGLEEGVDFFRGGYVYEISRPLADQLIAAGFPSG